VIWNVLVIILGQEVLFLLILWHSSVWRIILIISGLFFRKSLRYHHLYSLIYGFEVRRIDLSLWQSYFFLFFYYDNVSTVSHKPFHKLKRILIYSKRGSSCGNPITGEANLFLILSPISPFHCWSSIITEILTFQSFLMTSVLSFYKRKTKVNKEH
jgi:hypothetical protein